MTITPTCLLGRGVAYGSLLWPAAIFLVAMFQLLRADGVDGGQASGVSVPVISPSRTNFPRTTTQPATVHAYYNANIFAMTSGYLVELKADIGQPVKEGDVLAVIDVPELAKRFEVKQADIQRLEAEERRATADLAVAKAGADAYESKVEKARAELKAADALTTAAQAEWERVTDLVREKALAGRLLDEAINKLDSARAHKTALESGVQATISEFALARARCPAGGRGRRNADYTAGTG